MEKDISRMLGFLFANPGESVVSNQVSADRIQLTFEHR